MPEHPRTRLGAATRSNKSTPTSQVQMESLLVFEGDLLINNRGDFMCNSVTHN